jgi:DNA-binding NarL/FixJ family response regulator
MRSNVIVAAGKCERDKGHHLIRILLVADPGWLRQALALILDREPDFTVVAQVGAPVEVRDALDEVDVAVVKLGLPDVERVEVVRKLHQDHSGVRILALTGSPAPTQMAHAVEAGARGVLRTSASIDEIISGIRRLAGGEWLQSPDEIVRLLGLANHQREQNREAQLAIQRLTLREREVLQALATGLDSKEIAQLLGITISTERIHMMNILSKLGVHTRVQALVFAVRHGAVKIC